MNLDLSEGHNTCNLASCTAFQYTDGLCTETLEDFGDLTSVSITESTKLQFPLNTAQKFTFCVLCRYGNKKVMISPIKVDVGDKALLGVTYTGGTTFLDPSYNLDSIYN